MEQPNLEERMPCPCMRCKHQISRKRRICNEHLREYGMFPIERLQNLRFQSYGQQTNEQLSMLDEITPHVGRRPRDRLRSSEDVNINSRTDCSNSGGIDQEMEEEGMEEMLDAFYETDRTTNVQQQEEDEADEQHQEFGQEEEVMRKLARLPLYNGAKISVLRASLAMLNLQSMFGWSDASVTELFM